jgi:hypothetical protein
MLLSRKKTGGSSKAPVATNRMEVRMAEQRIPQTEERGENPREVAGEVLAARCRSEIERTGEHTFRVPSRSIAGRVYTVDLGVETCTCPDRQFGGNICAHMWAAAVVMMELESEPEYVIEKNPHAHYLYRHDAYMLVEYRAGERVRVIGYRPSWLDCYLDRADLWAAA